MKIRYLLLFVFISYSIFAQKKSSFLDKISIPINTRMDFRHLDYKVNDEQFPNDTRFQFSYFKIDMFGQILPGFTYRLRYSPVTSTLGTSGINNIIQLANVGYETANKRWYFEAGKSFLAVGTAEQQYFGADVYNWSLIAYNIEVYRTGLSIQYRFGNKQNIGFQFMNGSPNEVESVDNFEYNLYWFGAIGELANTYFSATTILGKNQNTIPYTINGGLQWKIGSYTLDTDFSMMYNFRNFYPETIYYSTPIQLRRVKGKWCPIIKYIYNAVNPLNDVIIDFNGEQLIVDEVHIHTIGGGIQYYPIPSKDIRVHLVSTYTFDDDLVRYVPPIEDIGNTRIGYNAAFQIIFGARINFDVLNGLVNR